MKLAHRPDIFVWSRFDEARELDFHSFVVVREGGNVVIDPLPMSEHDAAHLEQLGGAAWIVVTNSDHTRGAAELAIKTGARRAGPAGERGSFPLPCERWLAEGDELVPGIRALVFEGSKTPGELALLVDDDTLICGDLLRAHAGGRLDMLPAAKLTDRAAALASLHRLLDLPRLDAILVGDGWPAFRDARARLAELLIGDRVPA
jgi:metallo-beta-lactamase superfamily protein